MSKFASFKNNDEKFSIQSEGLPLLNEGEILVKNLCTSICRSDIHTFQGKRIEKSPTILGHEIVGFIQELGPNAPKNDLKGTPLKIGDKITWAIYASSPDDLLSKAAMPQKAKDLFKYGHEQITDTSHFHGVMVLIILGLGVFKSFKKIFSKKKFHHTISPVFFASLNTT